jgi:ribose 5-phosphate isomerase B
MRIFLGADHNGFDYKAKLAMFLLKHDYEVIDVGDTTRDPADDFPTFASHVVNELLATNDLHDRGILICGSGQGMCMAANRFNGIRASLCWNAHEARSVRNDDDSNVLCLSAKSTPLPEVEHIVSAWLTTPFAGAPRFIRRLKELDQLT